MRPATALAAAAAAAAADASAAGELKLKLLPGRAVCLDGTPAGYYSSRNASSDVWVVYLQGGGSCSTQSDCAARAKTNLGSSTSWGTNKQGNQVWSRDCTENPDFCAANIVYVPYCSGDAHRGQRNGTSSATFGFHFSGHNNFKAIIADIIAGSTTKPARVLLSGCSAGGTGVLTNADTLAAMLPKGTIAKASPLAGWFFPGDTSDHPAAQWVIPSPFPNFTAGVAADPAAVEAAFARIGALYDAYWQPRCVTALGAHAPRCHTAHVGAAYVETPLLISENMWDSSQLPHTMGVPGSAWKGGGTPELRAYAAYYAQAMRNSTLAAARRSGNGLFLPACYAHCERIGVGVRGGVPPATIGGRSYGDVLGDWFFERGSASPIVVDSCGDFPCNPTCPKKKEDDACGDDAP